MSCQPCKMDRSHLSSHSYPLEKLSDMPEEMKAEAKDTVVTALEKFPDNYEQAAKFVKEQMDKKYGSPWHCVMGEGFGFEITYELKHLMYMFHRGYTAIVVFKAL
jgi:dynein light chain 4, axonemal